MVGTVGAIKEDVPHTNAETRIDKQRSTREGIMLRQIKLVGIATAVVLSLSGAALARESRGAMNAKQYGYEYGYQDGYQYGGGSGNQGARYDYRGDEYRFADRGYDRSMGEHDDFQNGYRNGYKAGYDDGYYRRPSRLNQGYRRNKGYGANSRENADDPYSRNNSYDPYARDNGRGNGNANRDRGYGSQTAAGDVGYREGMTAGEKDRRKWKDFRPQKNDSYQDANHGYRKEYGDKNFYKDQYREAFVRGYEDGYGR